MAALVWGAELERSADRTARDLTPGLNARDILLIAALVFDRNGRALPTQLIGPVHTTAAGISGSLDRLEAAELVRREVGSDARTRPVQITQAGQDLVASIVAPWQQWFDSALARLDDDERADLYRLLVKASGHWDDVWPARSEDAAAS